MGTFDFARRPPADSENVRSFSTRSAARSHPETPFGCSEIRAKLNIHGAGFLLDRRRHHVRPTDALNRRRSPYLPRGSSSRHTSLKLNSGSTKTLFSTRFCSSGKVLFGKAAVTKRLQLLHDLVPQAAVIAFLMNPNNPNGNVEIKAAQTAAASLGNSTMTNSTVAHMVKGVEGDEINLQYKDGEKKIVVTPNTTIVTYMPGDKSEVKPGAKIFIAASSKKEDGTLEAPTISVNRDGITPPM